MLWADIKKIPLEWNNHLKSNNLTDLFHKTNAWFLWSKNLIWNRKYEIIDRILCEYFKTTENRQFRRNTENRYNYFIFSIRIRE